MAVVIWHGIGVAMLLVLPAGVGDVAALSMAAPVVVPLSAPPSSPMSSGS